VGSHSQEVIALKLKHCGYLGISFNFGFFAKVDPPVLPLSLSFAIDVLLKLGP
jgi:hypothetical protein